MTRRPYVARRRARRWLPYAGAALLLGLIAAGLWPQPVPVELARAGIGSLQATVNEEGKTRIKQRYTISAPVSGQLRRIPFKAGAPVTARQTLLAVIAPVPPTPLDARARTLAEARRDTAAANLQKARSTHDFAAAELRRRQQLYAQGAIAIEELETAQLREASSSREQAAAESSLREAEAELAEFTAGTSGKDTQPPLELKAPVSGQVLRVFEESARVVAAGTPLLEIGDPTSLEVVVEVLSRDGALIRPGMKVEFDQWGGTSPLLGKVRLVEPAAFTKVSALGVEEQRVNVIADFVTPPEQRLGVGDNFRVEARVIVWEAAQVLKVPAGALFRQGEHWATFVVQDGRARLRRVQVGRSSGTETQVTAGLQAGEQVILYPSSRVHDGQRVREITLGAS